MNLAQVLLGVCVVAVVSFAALAGEGARVQPLAPPDAATLWLDLARNDADRWVVVGGNAERQPGALFTSDDAGAHWTRRDHPALHRLYGVTFATPERAIAVGLGGTILLGAEGGAKWRCVHQRDGCWLAGVAFATAERGFAVGHQGDAAAVLLQSEDGGETWRDHASLPTSARTATLRAISFRDAEHGAIAGTGGTLLSTTDGGRTWSVGATLGDDYLRAIAWRGDELFVVGGAGVVARSRDGGATVERVAFAAGDKLNAIDFLDAEHGLIATMGGVLWSTADGGATWQRAATDAEGAHLTAITVAEDPGKAYVVGDGRFWRVVSRDP